MSHSWQCLCNAQHLFHFLPAGTSRKAYRLGKFLQHVNSARKVQLTSASSVCDLIAYAGDGIYYFIDQFVWLAKAGFIHKSHAKRLSKLGVWFEAIGYLGSISAHCIKLQVSGLRSASGTHSANLLDVGLPSSWLLASWAAPLDKPVAEVSRV